VSPCFAGRRESVVIPHVILVIVVVIIVIAVVVVIVVVVIVSEQGLPIKAPTHNRRSGVWVWARTALGLEGQNPYKYDKQPKAINFRPLLKKKNPGFLSRKTPYHAG
jgi:heme/copper-type cytochrome/quinol oxidase subunit 2